MGNSLSNKTVIVVGAGYVGGEVASILDSECNVILIEPQDATHHKLATARASIVPGWEMATRIKLDKLLKRGKIIQKSVKSVNENSVTLTDGETVTGDFIVLCHGAGNMLFPFSPLENCTDTDLIIRELRNNQHIIHDANNIIIVGGGPVGIEFAGEILAQYPTKSVTLIHNNEHLLNNCIPPIYPKGINKVMDRLKSMKCDIKLNVKIIDDINTNNGHAFITGHKEYNLSDGTKLNGDLVIICTNKFNNPTNILSNKYLNEKNQIKVNQFLQVEGMSNVFCCGDANNQSETKLVFTGSNQGKHVIRNIEALANGKSLIPYRGTEVEKFGAIFLPLGPHIGVGTFNTTIFGNSAVRLIKGKSIFCNTQFGIRNQKIPMEVPIV